MENQNKAMYLLCRESTWNRLDAKTFFSTGNWIHFEWPSREQGISCFYTTCASYVQEETLQGHTV